MGFFGLLSEYGETIIPQIGWLYTIPVTAIKDIPSYFLSNMPTDYPLYGFYDTAIGFLDRLVEIGTELPAIGFFIESVLSLTPMHIILPVTILLIVLILLIVKLIKIVLDIIPF